MLASRCLRGLLPLVSICVLISLVFSASSALRTSLRLSILFENTHGMIVRLCVALFFSCAVLVFNFDRLSLDLIYIFFVYLFFAVLFILTFFLALLSLLLSGCISVDVCLTVCPLLPQFNATSLCSLTGK